MKLPQPLREPNQTKHKKIYDTVNDIISFLEEKFPHKCKCHGFSLEEEEDEPIETDPSILAWRERNKPHWESDYAAIWERFEHSAYDHKEVRQDILELIRKVAK